MIIHRRESLPVQRASKIKLRRDIWRRACDICNSYIFFMSDPLAGPPSGMKPLVGRVLSCGRCCRTTEPPCRRLVPFGLRPLPRHALSRQLVHLASRRFGGLERACDPCCRTVLPLAPGRLCPADDHATLRQTSPSEATRLKAGPPLRSGPTGCLRLRPPRSRACRRGNRPPPE